MAESHVTAETHCACGAPLHYADPWVRRAVEQLVAVHGPTVQVTVPGGAWHVPRHWIALHGLRAAELPALARRYGWAPA